MSETRHETWEPVCWIVLDNGTAIGWAHDVTSTDDWRETPWGQVNFGSTVVGPRRLVKKDARR